jgi:hypothetical protein
LFSGSHVVTRCAPPEAAITPRTRSVESSSGQSADTPLSVGITACAGSREADESAPSGEAKCRTSRFSSRKPAAANASACARAASVSGGSIGRTAGGIDVGGLNSSGKYASQLIATGSGDGLM